jgi:DNA-binding HxlR family transcriptional regulator
MQVCYPTNMKHVKRRSDCPISFALDVFGDKWSLLIIRDLMFKGKVYYGDFLGSEEKIATNILANRLGMLEGAGMISKAQDPRMKTKYIYSLAEKGIDLLPVLIEIILWSAKYDPKTGAPKEFVARARKDKSGLIRDIIKNIKSGDFIFPSRS